MVNWQITATTILCNATGSEVTVMAYKDGSLKCTGESALTRPQTKTAPCTATACSQVLAYRDKLLSEEDR